MDLLEMEWEHVVWGRQHKILYLSGRSYHGLLYAADKVWAFNRTQQSILRFSFINLPLNKIKQFKWLLGLCHPEQMVTADKMVKAFSETMAHRLIHYPRRAGLNADESRKVVFPAPVCVFPATHTFPEKKSSWVQPAMTRCQGFLWSIRATAQKRETQRKRGVAAS